MATNQAVLALVPDERECASEFLYLWMSSRTGNLRNKSGGAAQKNLSKALVLSEPFPDASLGEQQLSVSQWAQMSNARRTIETGLERLAALRKSLLESLLG